MFTAPDRRTLFEKARAGVLDASQNVVPWDPPFSGAAALLPTFLAGAFVVFHLSSLLSHD